MPEGNLKNVILDPHLRWIFVGGKGGVGKTTTSCSLAIQLARTRESVLLISTDPAHNVSDALKQKLGSSPTPVNGFKNFYAMEVDPASQMTKLVGTDSAIADDGELSSIKQLLTMFPGMDEAMTLSGIIELVKSQNFSCVIFDTAPTGHTLKFLSFPAVLEKTLEKAENLGGRFSGMFKQISSLFPAGDDIDLEKMIQKLKGIRMQLKRVNDEFTDSTKTTFICVCISEFLSLYETERLIQELAENSVEVHNIVVNQLIQVTEDSTCKTCTVRSKMQRKYLDEAYDLYEDFNITEIPICSEEIRGIEKISEFSKMLLEERNLFGLRK